MTRLMNVLLKVVGLYMVLSGIPQVFSIFASALWATVPVRSNGPPWFIFVYPLLGPLIGGVVIAKSEQIAKVLLKYNR